MILILRILLFSDYSTFANVVLLHPKQIKTRNS